MQTILKNTKKIEELLFEEQKENLMPFVNTLEAFKEVVETCFGYSFHENFDRAIEKFEEMWMNLKNSFGISVPTKCHIIFRHVKDFIQEKRQPIGMLSEQVVEATHSKWSNIWDNYKVRHLHREEYGDKILRKEFFKNKLFPP